MLSHARHVVMWMHAAGNSHKVSMTRDPSRSTAVTQHCGYMAASHWCDLEAQGYGNSVTGRYKTQTDRQESTEMPSMQLHHTTATASLHLHSGETAPTSCWSGPFQESGCCTGNMIMLGVANDCTQSTLMQPHDRVFLGMTKCITDLLVAS